MLKACSTTDFYILNAETMVFHHEICRLQNDDIYKYIISPSEKYLVTSIIEITAT